MTYLDLNLAVVVYKYITYEKSTRFNNSMQQNTCEVVQALTARHATKTMNLLQHTTIHIHTSIHTLKHLRIHFNECLVGQAQASIKNTMLSLMFISMWLLLTTRGHSHAITLPFFAKSLAQDL